jgi:HEAT repeat protein
VVLLDHAAAVRITSVMALSRMKASPRVDETLFRAARDEDERVAVAAIGVLGGAQSARRRLVIAPVLAELAKHDSAGVSAAARDVLARFSTDAAVPEVRVRAQLGGVRR